MPDNCGNYKRSGSLESQSGDSLKKLIEVVRGPSKVKENRRSIENSSSFRPKEMNKRVSTIVKRSSAFLGVNSMKMGSRILKTEFSTNGET